MKSITPDRCQQELQEKGGTDFAIEFTDGYRFRVAVFKQRGNIGMVLRRIPSEFLTFEQIGMPDAIKRLITRPRGLLLVTGPTGSGKTTSLASMINFINDNYDKHIITLEDPIEYYHKHKKCTVNQREIGVDVPELQGGHPPRPAYGPRHHPRRRNARPGNDPRRHRGGRDRPRRLRHAAHQRGVQHGQPHHRRVPQGAAGPDPHAAVHRPHRRAVADACCRRSRRAWSPPTR